MTRLGAPVFALALLVAGCGPAGAENADLAGGGSSDLTSAAPDLSEAAADLAQPRDLTAVHADLKVGPDLATPPDLFGQDLVGADLKPAPDLAGPPVAWGQACTGNTNCVTAAAGQTAFCATTLGTPICIETCNTLGDYALCQGGNGICVPGDGEKFCVKKCGDAANVGCGNGSACAFLGYVAQGGDLGFRRVGACLPDCAASGADACMEAGRVCNPVEKLCARTDCGGACPTNSTCVSGVCTANTPIGLYGNCTRNAGNAANGCLSNLCFGEVTQPGFCGKFCDSANGDAECGAGGVCWLDNNASDPNLPGGQFTVTGGRTLGACMKTCVDSANCPANFHCAEYNGKRACILGAIDRYVAPTAGTVLAGGLCRANGDCASNSCAFATGYRDGRCQRPSTGATCPGGTVAGAGTDCIKSCNRAVHLSCGAGSASWVCDNTSQCSIGLCRENADCAATHFCEVKSGTCRPNISPSPGVKVVGEACAADAECGGSCIEQQATAPLYVNGYCTSACSLLPSFADTCPVGAICTAPTVAASGICLDLCDAPAGGISRYGNCRTGYSCSLFAADNRFGFCDSSL